MDEIEEFIHRRFSSDCDWMRGNCYYFAAILALRFPQLHIVYFPIDGHFATIDRDHNYFYDWRGKYQSPEFYYYWDSSFESSEPNIFQRIVQDCIM